MTDADFMALALDEARMAAKSGEVPVGAVLVRQGQVIATGRNALVSGHDPTAHAEIVALRAAAKILGNYRLNECELFVTLEPCAMCSGAILNARLKRVVFGAPEPKTGAAGSVVNLFATTALNHRTEWQGGMLAEASCALMQDFFRQRRVEQRASARRRHPLRDDALRTPDAAFDGLPDYPWNPNYRSDLPALDRLRMHYLDEKMVSSGDAAKQESITYLCLHDFSGWSYGFRQLISSLLESGDRVVVPDLIGFGKSDKPKKAAFHTLARHRQIMVELVEALDLRNIVLVLPERQSLLGLTLPMAAPLRYRGLQRISVEGSFTEDEQTLNGGLLVWNQARRRIDNDHCLIHSSKLKKIQPSHSIDPGCDAPFPGQSYRTGSLVLSVMAQGFDNAENRDIFRETESFWTFHSKR
ncbi:tRNA adenosine(34) deaminase TadA [Polaromonas sp.]|uniref:tRNA adenosine(34) deaminase TadA n=1 Tax=Polaromonas sp. TaxID=1869339 RepID=UPI0013BBCA97|nr:tRNA adenosine(34) deaminase TadA [Polaromonas sp.]NDP62252.1 tRNA-specific adenosine deaminase [Polaromonas sp.]